MTFKDLKKRVALETAQESKAFEVLRNKPFWIWNIEEHKQEDIKSNGDCCFNHIIGLPTDSLRAYEPAFRKQFNIRKTAHVKTKSIEEGFANRPIERYHNEVRAVLMSKRGLGNDKSAQEFADGQRIYHNFCRPHTGLPNGITPAEAAGIDLNLGENKIKALIEKSAEAKEQTKSEYNIEVQLGKRIEHVNIVREKDCISIKPKSWIDKPIWREINDILSINGFSWLENGKESEWIKMKEL